MKYSVIFLRRKVLKTVGFFVLYALTVIFYLHCLAVCGIIQNTHIFSNTYDGGLVND